MKLLMLFLAIVLFHTSCKEECDDVFRTHVVEVRAENVEEAYTVRTRNSDTINHYTEIASDTAFFEVAGDEFKGRLREGGENFLFHLRTPDSLYQFNYLFDNGDCHVEKLSGHDRITL